MRIFEACQICSGRNQHPWRQAAPEDGQHCLHPGGRGGADHVVDDADGGADDVVDDGDELMIFVFISNSIAFSINRSK